MRKSRLDEPALHVFVICQDRDPVTILKLLRGTVF
jgi:hypothetical protein